MDGLTSSHYLREKGFEEVVVGGGVQIYNAFLNSGTITDIYFNFVPVIVGDGGVLGTAENLVTHYRVASHTLLAEGIVQVHLTETAQGG
ncbi:dihydrofolate reductase family protein [Pseudochryseolinea flava]|nr:dihydrofolate reductase family protein [Pseudochryseolinea flava]